VTNGDGKNGAQSKKVAEKIIRAFDLSDQLMFLIKWRGIKKFDEISAKEAYSKCPQLVLNYYEEIIVWSSTALSCASSNAGSSKKHTKRSKPNKKAHESDKLDKPDKSENSDGIQDVFNVDGEQNGVTEDVTNYNDENGAPPEKVAEKIIGANMSRGQLMFVIKWRGIEKFDAIVAKEAYSKFLQLALKFFEENIVWIVSY